MENTFVCYAAGRSLPTKHSNSTRQAFIALVAARWSCKRQAAVESASRPAPSISINRRSRVRVANGCLAQTSPANKASGVLHAAHAQGSGAQHTHSQTTSRAVRSVRPRRTRAACGSTTRTIRLAVMTMKRIVHLMILVAAEGAWHWVLTAPAAHDTIRYRGFLLLQISHDGCGSFEV